MGRCNPYTVSFAHFVTIIHLDFLQFSHPHSGFACRIAQRLLEPESTVFLIEYSCMRMLISWRKVVSLFARNPFEKLRPPSLIRIQMYALTPTTVAHLRKTGEWWSRSVNTRVCGVALRCGAVRSVCKQNVVDDEQAACWSVFVSASIQSTSL